MRKETLLLNSSDLKVDIKFGLEQPPTHQHPNPPNIMDNPLGLANKKLTPLKGLTHLQNKDLGWFFIVLGTIFVNLLMTPPP